MPDWLADAVIAHAANGGTVMQRHGSVVARDFRPSGAGGSAEVDAVVAALAARGLTPPTVSELALQLARPDLSASLRAAAAQGRAEAVERDRYYARSVLDDFVRVLGEIALQGEFGAARCVTAPASAGSSYSLLEWADARGWTIRHGDLRRFRGGPAAVAASGPAAAGPA